jgi:exportin-1
MLGKIEGTELAQQFYEAYFLSLLQDVFAVLTDTLHKTGFKSQVRAVRAEHAGLTTLPRP